MARTPIEDARIWRNSIHVHLDLIVGCLTGRRPWAMPTPGAPDIDPDLDPRHGNAIVIPHRIGSGPVASSDISDPTARGAQARGDTVDRIALQLVEQHDHLWEARCAAYHDAAPVGPDIPPPWHHQWPRVLDLTARSIRRAVNDLYDHADREFTAALTIRAHPRGHGGEEVADGRVTLNVTPWTTTIGEVASTLETVATRTGMYPPASDTRPRCNLTGCHRFAQYRHPTGDRTDTLTLCRPCYKRTRRQEAS